MLIRLFATLMLLGAAAHAQDFSARATVDLPTSALRDDGDGLRLDLHLSQVVPYRVFTLDDPPRAVLDFREIDWQDAQPAAILNADNAIDLRFGPLRPGWSRMVIALAAPLALSEAGMQVNTDTGTAHLAVTMAPTTPEAFAASAGAPVDPGWEAFAMADPVAPANPGPDAPPVIAIDAGHGGIDPGAEQGGLREADLMLALAFDLADAINRSGVMRAVLIRDADFFVPLEDRMTRARAAGAVAFISLHADALEGGGASGAAVYTLSEASQDGAAQRMAERHERGDLLAGLDLTNQGDRVATVLMELARLETGPSGDALADFLVNRMGQAGVAMNSRPRRSGPFAVLNAPDFASVLIEAGFLTSAADRAALSSPDGRAKIAAGILAGLLDWTADRAARAPLIRQ